MRDLRISRRRGDDDDVETDVCAEVKGMWTGCDVRGDLIFLRWCGCERDVEVDIY